MSRERETHRERIKKWNRGRERESNGKKGKGNVENGKVGKWGNGNPVKVRNRWRMRLRQSAMESATAIDIRRGRGCGFRVKDYWMLSFLPSKVG